MLEVRSVSRHYGDFKAVSDVSFAVDQGEIIGLLGHNGAGKTTIMKMLSGYLEPDTGEILFNQESVVENPATLQIELGYLPENLPVYPELSVASYLDYAAELKGLKGDAKLREIRRVVEATELGEKFLSSITTLSRGLKQRVGVAQAIIGNPSLLILDEPTNGLDPSQTEQMRSLIRSISESATVILSTHIMQEVEAVCDRALIIRQGELAVDARLSDLTSGQQVSLLTHASSASVESALSAVQGLTAMEQHGYSGADDVQGASETRDSASQWVLQLKPGMDVHDTISQCAKALVNANVPILSLSPQVRDLQTLFLEVNTRGTADSVTNSAEVEVSNG